MTAEEGSQQECEEREGGRRGRQSGEGGLRAGRVVCGAGRTPIGQSFPLLSLNGVRYFDLLAPPLPTGMCDVRVILF